MVNWNFPQVVFSAKNHASYSNAKSARIVEPWTGRGWSLCT
jgi:hypothetical protein